MRNRVNLSTWHHAPPFMPRLDPVVSLGNLGRDLCR